MDDFKRVLGYALRHRGKIVAIVFCALAVGLLFSGSIIMVKPVTATLVEPNGLESMREWAHAEKYPTLGRLVNWFVGLFPQQDRDGRFITLVWLSVLAVGVTFFRGIFRFLQDYLVGIVASTAVYDIRNKLYVRAIRFDLSYFGEAGVAKTMSRFTFDAQVMKRGIRMLFGSVIREPIKAVMCLALALAIDWQLTLLSLAAGPLVGFAIYRFGRAVKRYTRRVLSHFSFLNNILQETFLGLPIVKAFSMEAYESQRFIERNRRVRRNEIRVERADAATAPTTEFLAVAAVAGVALVAGWRVLHRGMPIDDFVTLYAALIGLYDPARKMSKVNNRMQEMLAAARRVFSLMDAEPKVAEKPDAPALPRMKKDLAFRDVRFRYATDGPEVLRGITLTVGAEEVVAIVGHSGAGKTSLINLIPRFYDPTDGVVEVDGVDIRGVSLESLRGQIALVTQHVVLFEDTVANNIAYGQHECPIERVVQAATAAHAHEFIEHLPDGYDTMIGERGESLSGGQRARLAIARAVLRDPAILILDEATANLDSESETLIQQALTKLQAGRATIVIAHRLSTIQHAHRVVVLHEGRIESEGAHEALLETSPIYRSLYQLQFGLAQEVEAREVADE